MKILALDTATEACSAALWSDGQVFERYRVAPREHNALILPMIEELLAEAAIQLDQLDALAFGRGPGSFTGVRIAAGVVQGIGLATGLPVLPVSTLAALALSALREHPDAHWALPGIDARMQEVYCAVYVPDVPLGVRLVGAEWVVPPSHALELVFPAGAGVGVGSAWVTYRETLHAAAGGRILNVLTNPFPRACHVAELAAHQCLNGGAVPARDAVPTYVRDRVTHLRGSEISAVGSLAEQP
jgi:tRNA threonylcarbamoyladenosine biosynthesis protein TsaB